MQRRRLGFTRLVGYFRSPNNDEPISTLISLYKIFSATSDLKGYWHGPQGRGKTNYILTAWTFSILQFFTVKTTHQVVTDSSPLLDSSQSMT